jgi:predicted nucleotidyltransferase
MTAVREATSYVRSARLVLKQLKAELKIDNVALYEEYLQAKYYQIIMLALDINYNGAAFNEVVLSFFRDYPTISEINRLIETQKEYKEEKNEFIIEQVENSHLRSTSLIEKMKEDSKIWKNKYK